jgi:hypothetical protein
VPSWALSWFCSTMFGVGGTTGQAQLDVAAISRLDVDVAPSVATTRERFTAVLGSCVRAFSSKTRRPALPPETHPQTGAAGPSHPNSDSGPEEIARRPSATGTTSLASTIS